MYQDDDLTDEQRQYINREIAELLSATRHPKFPFKFIAQSLYYLNTRWHGEISGEDFFVESIAAALQAASERPRPPDLTR